jgi:DNA-directed RNA polymerase subunit RPC12/RpoP
MIDKYYFCPNCKFRVRAYDVAWGNVEIEERRVEVIYDETCSECGGNYKKTLKEWRYICPDCDAVLQEIEQDFESEEVPVFNIGGRDYSKPIRSESLAINPDQIEEHRRLFPDITVSADGILEFDNFRKHENYLKKTGFNKCTQRKKSVGKTLGGKTIAKINRSGKAEIY